MSLYTCIHFLPPPPHTHTHTCVCVYSLIAFDEKLTFWFQRPQSLPCARVFAALYACAIV